MQTRQTPKTGVPFMPSNIFRVDTMGSRYPFDSLKHGDTLQVNSIRGAQEMFRRWKNAKSTDKRRRGRLVPSREYADVLVFIDETII